MMRRPPRSTPLYSSAASDVYKRQDYRVGAVHVSAKGKKIIQQMVKGKKVDAESSGLSKREWNELMISFNFNDKVI